MDSTYSPPGGDRFAVVAFHYAAREYIHAFLADEAQTDDWKHPKDHGATMKAILACLHGTEKEEVQRDLQLLRDLSELARYLENPLSRHDGWYRASYASPHDAASTSYGAMRRIATTLGDRRATRRP